MIPGQSNLDAPGKQVRCLEVGGIGFELRTYASLFRILSLAFRTIFEVLPYGICASNPPYPPFFGCQVFLL